MHSRRSSRSPGIGRSPTPRRVYLFLALGLVVASQSANIVRLGDAHPVAITCWRLLLATAVLLPLAGRELTSLRRLSAVERLLLIGAGVALAAHFFAFIGAVQATTVANAVTFFSVNPVLTAAAAFVLFRERPSTRLTISIALGVGGVSLLGWAELTLSPENLDGDGLALLCAMLFSCYFLLGQRLRRSLPTSSYVAAVYGVAALVALVTLLALDLPLVRYDEQTWLCFALMAAGPTLIGHTSFNHALAHLPASFISTATLTEPLLAGLVAAAVWGEEMTLHGLVGYGLICLSVVVLVRASSRATGGKPQKPEEES